MHRSRRPLLRRRAPASASAPRRATGVVALLVAAVLSACATGRSGGSAGSATSGGQKLLVVAAENMWGSIAAQLGGDRVEVHSIVDNPAADPHDYEPTPADARAIASARYVIVNGVGYDAWATRLVDANRGDGIVLDVGDLAGRSNGDNPHLWYVPDVVDRVVERITADLQTLDPAATAAYQQRRSAYESDGLGRYKQLLAQIRQRYAGTPVGASESIFEGVAQATGLDLVTPPSFLAAVTSGNDATAHDKATVDRQIATGAIRVFVVNAQNTTPDVRRLVEAARARGIPVTSITETLSPAGATFQDWQADQLRALVDALSQAPRP